MGQRGYWEPVSCAQFQCDLIKTSKWQFFCEEFSTLHVCHIDLFHYPCWASLRALTCQQCRIIEIKMPHEEGSTDVSNEDSQA